MSAHYEEVIMTQSTYHFTLVLENTPDLEDKLYQANCDDSLVNFRNRAVYLDFDRVAASFEDAVIEAIKDTESAELQVMVINVAPDNFVSEAEIAKRLDLKRQAVSLWVKGTRRKQNPFPKPVMKLTEKSPLWKWSEVTKWLFQNKQIQNPEIVSDALFIENINAALEERDANIRKSRKNLLRKLAA